MFAGRHFDREVIVLCVRWYFRYKLSLRDLVEMMAERGPELAQYGRLPAESKERDVAAARAFFHKALRTQGRAPLRITLDGYAASHRAVREMPSENEIWKHTRLRSSKYLNNPIEQDHRGIKSRTGPVLGFRRFVYAAITIAGIELLRRIHKGQFALGSLRPKDQAAPAIGNAVLAA